MSSGSLSLNFQPTSGRSTPPLFLFQPRNTEAHQGKLMGFFLASVSLLRRPGSRLSLCGILAPGGVRLREPIRSRRALPEGDLAGMTYKLVPRTVRNPHRAKGCAQFSKRASARRSTGSGFHPFGPQFRFLEERAHPFTTADPRSNPTSIFCRPA